MSEELNKFAKSCEAEDAFNREVAEQALERFKHRENFKQKQSIESWHVIVPNLESGNIASNRFICKSKEDAIYLAGNHGPHAKIEVVFDLTR